MDCLGEKVNSVGTEPPCINLKKDTPLKKINHIKYCLFLLLLILAGCATTPPPTPNIVWPLPPEEPKIKYMAAYRDINDFPKTVGERIKEALFGTVTGLSLKKPTAVTTDIHGRIYVADSSEPGIFVFNLEERKIELWGQEGQLKPITPLGLAIDAQGNVYVSDGRLKKILVYDKYGKLIFNIGDEHTFVNPSGIAVDKTRNRLLVADSKAHKVKVFDLKGKLIFELEGSDIKGGKFYAPSNIAVDKEGNFYVVEALNFRVQIFDAQGKYIRNFGQLGANLGHFARPRGIAVDSEGHIYVVDAAFNNFQIFDPEGQLLLFVGTGGYNPGEFLLPYGIWIDKEDKIYVTDQIGNPRVQVFQYLKK